MRAESVPGWGLADQGGGEAIGPRDLFRLFLRVGVSQRHCSRASVRVDRPGFDYFGALSVWRVSLPAKPPLCPQPSGTVRGFGGPWP